MQQTRQWKNGQKIWTAISPKISRWQILHENSPTSLIYKEVQVDWLKLKRRTIPSVDKGMGELALSNPDDRSVKWCNCFRKSGRFLKFKRTLTIWFNFSNPKVYVQTKTCMNVQSRNRCDSQKLGASQMSTNGGRIYDMSYSGVPLGRKREWLLIHTTTCVNLKLTVWVKEARRRKRTHFLWSHLYKTPENDNPSSETESLPGDNWRGTGEAYYKGAWRKSGGWGCLLSWVWWCMTWNSKFVYFKYVQFVVYPLYPQKVLEKGSRVIAASTQRLCTEIHSHLCLLLVAKWPH